MDYIATVRIQCKGGEDPVVYSEAHETFFIHVPKCAGTSVKKALRQNGFTMSLHRMQPDEMRTGTYRLGTAARMRGIFDAGLWQRSFKFAVCRNPYERLFSGWAFCRQTLGLQLPFDYFVRHLHTFRTFWVEWHCVLPQLRHLVVDGVQIADHICRFEHLDEDMDVIRTRLGTPNLHLPHLNRSSHGPYREAFTKELQDLAFAHFAVDFEYFGYEYDL